MTTTKKPDGEQRNPHTVVPWDLALVNLRALYRAEVERLAGEFRPRIVAGEWSGDESPVTPRYLRLQDELVRRHPWLGSDASALAVIAFSSWRTNPAADVEVTWPVESCAAECLAWDILGVAVEQGWVRRPCRDGGSWPAPARSP